MHSYWDDVVTIFIEIWDVWISLGHGLVVGLVVSGDGLLDNIMGLSHPKWFLDSILWYTQEIHELLL